MEDKIFEYCKANYDKAYNAVKGKLEQEYLKRSKKQEISESKELKIETTAQLQAIKNTMLEGRKKFPTQIPLLWSCIYKTHLYRKSGISDPAVVANAILAEQSWRASSGHAFEEMVKELGTLALSGTNIQYILQKDLNTLLKAKELANSPTDIAWLEKQVMGSVFDAYVIAYTKVLDEDTNEVTIKPICFGCVQCKTSIRDRVSRDIVPSREAMESKFWSIGFVLDGTMFSVPKYMNMVNGNVESEFKRNGWHGMYVLSTTESVDRLYGVDTDFNVVKDHTLKAYEAWHKDRMGFGLTWRADDK